MLPLRFQSSSGINDHLYLDAVSELQTRAGQDQPPQLISKQKAWDIPLVESPRTKCCPPHLPRLGLPASMRLRPPYYHVLQLALVLDDTSIRIAIATRLGAPACDHRTCICGVTVDSSGTHGLSCRKSAGRLMRYSALNDLIKRSLTTAEIPSRLEPTSLSRSDGERPDGLSLMPWKHGRCLVVGRHMP